jgi:hypothetical protein
MEELEEREELGDRLAETGVPADEVSSSMEINEPFEELLDDSAS